MPSPVRRALRMPVLFAIVACGVSYSGAQACDRPHYARPMPRAVQSRIPPSAAPSSAAKPGAKAYVDPETGRLSESPPPASADGERAEQAPEAPTGPAATEPAPSGGVKAKFGRERFPH